jgi:hypothetical protein
VVQTSKNEYELEVDGKEFSVELALLLFRELNTSSGKKHKKE